MPKINYMKLDEFAKKSGISIRSIEDLIKDGYINTSIKKLQTNVGKRETRVVYKSEYFKLALYYFATRYYVVDENSSKVFTERKKFVEAYNKSFKKSKIDIPIDYLLINATKKIDMLRKIETAYEQNDDKRILELIKLMRDVVENREFKDKTTLIIDTNILLNSADILKSINTSMYHIIVPDVVQGELDRMNHSKSKLRRRADNAIGVIKDLKLHDKAPYDEKWLKKHIQDEPKVDDKILATCIFFKDQNPRLVTEDKNLINDAKRNKVQVLNLDEIVLTEDYGFNLEKNKKMIESINRKDLNKFRVLIDDPDVDLNYIDMDGYTPLIKTIKKYNKSFFNILLNCKRFDELDLNKNSKDRLCFTPFMHASKNKDFYYVKELYKKGADPSIGSTGKNRQNTALLVASWDGNIKMVKYLIEECDVSINQTDSNGFTALIKSAIKTKPHITKYLIEKGADTRMRSVEGKTALEYAVEKLERFKMNSKKEDEEQKLKNVIELLRGEK